MLDNWQRIEQIIKWTGVASVNAFAREIGLNRGENLYQIKRGNNGISKELAESIAAKYPVISKAWILTGEGDMLPGKGSRQKFEIPFYKSDAVDLMSLIASGQLEMPARAGATYPPDSVLEPAYYISFPMMQGCDFAAFSFSNAMQPDIPAGATLFFEHTLPQSFVPGKIYLIHSKIFKGIRFIRRQSKSDLLTLVPRNTVDFDEVEISPDQIEKLFEVKGVLITK